MQCCSEVNKCLKNNKTLFIVDVKKNQIKAKFSSKGSKVDNNSISKKTFCIYMITSLATKLKIGLLFLVVEL